MVSGQQWFFEVPWFQPGDQAQFFHVFCSLYVFLIYANYYYISFGNIVKTNKCDILLDFIEKKILYIKYLFTRSSQRKNFG